ncbi:dabb-domain-containing protein [Ramicandelaber brevisporus]|nr:dabb-domain-containing protein [Ramicandelaber brevisporus]
MPVVHIALFKFKPEASAARIDSLIAELNKLASSVPGVISLRAGANFSHKSQGFTHGLVSEHATREDLQKYYDHPNHLAVVHQAADIREDILLFDYDV